MGKATRGIVPKVYYQPHKDAPWTTLKKVGSTKDLFDKKETWMYSGDGYLLIHWADGEIERIRMLAKGNFDVLFPFCIKADDRDTQTYLLGTTNKEYESNIGRNAKDKVIRIEIRGTTVTTTQDGTTWWIPTFPSDNTGNSTTTERTDDE